LELTQGIQNEEWFVGSVLIAATPDVEITKLVE
jgi:hypothetical protein